ncbi:unnamed protein product, partial [Brassica oleracea]
SNSSTDSSHDPVARDADLFENGIIRLAEEQHVMPAVPSKALAPAPTGEKGIFNLEYITKGKDKVCNVNEGKKKRSYTSGHRSLLTSNLKFPDHVPDADTMDEDNDSYCRNCYLLRYMSSNANMYKEEAKKHLFVGQVFMDRSVFKTHMSLCFGQQVPVLVS